MHPNKAFRGVTAERNIAFARERGFGIVSLNGADGPILAHVPFLLSADGATLDLHLVRSNPIAAALRGGAQRAVIAVSGPDGYVSPDWYGIADQVPTWNYVAVHLRGTLSLLAQSEMKGMLDRQSAFFETRLEPKKPWTSDKMSDGTMERMVRAIVPCRMDVTEIEATWKLNQNKPGDVRHAAASQIESGVGTGLQSLAALMRAPDGQGDEG